MLIGKGHSRDLKFRNFSEINEQQKLFGFPLSHKGLIMKFAQISFRRLNQEGGGAQVLGHLKNRVKLISIKTT